MKTGSKSLKATLVILVLLWAAINVPSAKADELPKVSVCAAVYIIEGVKAGRTENEILQGAAVFYHLTRLLREPVPAFEKETAEVVRTFTSIGTQPYEAVAEIVIPQCGRLLDLAQSDWS